jgi:transcriptional regulator GlxA family with amidase domain
MQVGIFLYDGVEELDVIGVYEVLAKAKQLHPPLSLSVRTRARQETITCALGVKILAHEVRPDFDDLDLLIVPGGPGRKGVVADRELLAAILAFGTEKPIASVCTGAMILKEAGLLAGRRATTHHDALAELRPTADIVEERVVEDGLVTTSGGVTASIDLGLRLLAKYFDPGLAQEVADHLEYRATEARLATTS